MKTINGWVIALVTLLMLFAPWAFAQVGPGIMGPVGGGFTGGTVPNDATFSGNVRIDGTLDQRGTISNGGSATCFTGITGVPCFTESIGITATDATANIQAGTTAGTAGIITYNSSGTGIGVARYYGSTFAQAQLQNKMVFAGIASAGVITGNFSAVAAGTAIHEFRDGTLLENLLASIDGAGNLSLAAGATRTKGTITLAAGTGTATVTSGCVPACSDTTAVAAVRCAVSGTTLTATGTGTDVISYLCL